MTITSASQDRRQPVSELAPLTLVEMKAEASRLSDSGHRLTDILNELRDRGPGAPRNVKDVKKWIDPEYAAMRLAKDRANRQKYRAARRQNAKPAPPAPAIRFPTPPAAFTRGYRRALAAGIDPLEQFDAINECRHGRLPGYTGTACTCWTPAAVSASLAEKAAA